ASEAALAYALGFAKHYNAQLYPANACDPVILTEVNAVNVLDQIAENSRQQLEKLARNNKIKGPALFARGPIEGAFPGWIDEHGIDLVCAVMLGRRGLQRFLMGSTAEYIFRNAHCPLLTVGPHVAVRPYSGFVAENILFPTDLGAHAEFAATYALSFAHESRGRLTFMHIMPLESALKADQTRLIAAKEKLG